MANVQFQEATFFSRTQIGKTQTAQNMRISVKNDIEEVLSAGVDTVVNSYEVTDGEVTFFGKTAIKLLYNDGITTVGANYTADLAESLQNSALSGSVKCSFDVATVDVKVETNANTAVITVLSEVTVWAYLPNAVTYLADSNDVFVRKESVEALTAADVKNLPFSVEEELVASQTISTVLMAESALCVCDYVNTNGVLRVSGKATVRLTYLSEGNVVTDVLPFDFNSEFDATEIPSNAQLFLMPFVKATKVRLDIAEDSVNTEFSVDIAALLQLEQTVSSVLEIVADAYGTDCDFDFQRQNMKTTLSCGSIVANKRANGTLSWENKEVVTAVNIGALVTKCTSLEKAARVEGVISATVLCRGENGLESTRVELPFIQTVDVDFLAPQCESFATVVVEEFTLSGGENLAYDAQLCIAVDAFRDVDYNVIVSAEEVPFDKRKLAAVEVCLARKGETLWELAKGLHMSAEDLIAVNPEVADPLEKDARIVVYNKI